MDFLKQLIKNSGNEDAATVEAGLDADVAGFLNTGSFAFNALVSGSLYGGIPGNKITALAGESSTGKTWFALSLVEQFLKDYPKGAVIYFDTEQAVTTEMFESRKIDGSRVAVFPVSTIEQFKHQSLKIVEQVLEQKEEDRIPMMFVLDSLGMLSTEKEVTDAAEGKNVRDMTRAQGVRSTFRVLSVKLGKAGIPLVVTNHTYNVVGSYVPTRDMSGGEGLKYSASTIIYLSKKKDKDASGEVVGNIIHCKTYKSRFTKENREVDVQLNFETGLNPFYGLVDIALKHGVFKKVSTRIELPDGTTAFEKNINENPEKYFTASVMEKLEDAVAKEFKYGTEE